MNILFSKLACALAGASLLMTACSSGDAKMKIEDVPDDKLPKGTQFATLGGGCFWCVEAVLEQIDGVHSVKSGYMGGTKKNPTYREVCSKIYGHIEVVRVAFDPKKISYEDLLEAFWILHDPTSKDKQENDAGIQYRSIIFYEDEAQKKAAERSKAVQDKTGKYSKNLVTEIRKVDTFYLAEEEHQDYFQNNPYDRYCNAFIPPKLIKLFKDKRFANRLKKNKKEKDGVKKDGEGAKKEEGKKK